MLHHRPSRRASRSAPPRKAPLAEWRRGRRPARLSLAEHEVGVRSRSSGRLGQSERLELEPHGNVPYSNQTKVDAIRPVHVARSAARWNNVLWYVKARRRCHRQQVHLPTSASGVGDPSRQRDPLGRHCGYGHRVRLRPELVGRARIRSPLRMGSAQHSFGADRRSSPQRRHQAGGGSGNGSRELPLGGPIVAKF